MGRLNFFTSLLSRFPIGGVVNHPARIATMDVGDLECGEGIILLRIVVFFPFRNSSFHRKSSFIVDTVSSISFAFFYGEDIFQSSRENCIFSIQSIEIPVFCKLRRFWITREAFSFGCRDAFVKFDEGPRPRTLSFVFHFNGRRKAAGIPVCGPSANSLGDFADNPWTFTGLVRDHVYADNIRKRV